MNSGMRHTVQIALRFLGAASLLMAFSAAAPRPNLVTPTSSGEAQSARNVEVRLRKLHLVRPDLIPYPLAYEVYC